MRRFSAAIIIVAGLICEGCNRQQVSDAPESRLSQRPPTTLPSIDADPVVARVGGHTITRSQLEQPLIEAYGLNVLLNLVQLELAKDQATRARVTVSPHDVLVERDLTLKRLFPDAEEQEYESLMEQFLQQQRISKAEFFLVLETNANLRQIVEPQIQGKVSEASLEEAYRQTYGETVRVRHIQCANMTEIVEAKQRLEAGEPFEQVAEAISRNARTRPLGGELPPFSRAATAYPQAFRDAAFALKAGEVSDPVQADGYFHLIKLDERIAPKAVKFEDVKQSLREDLEAKLIEAGMQRLRNQIAQEARRKLTVEEPVLRQQYAQRLEAADAQIRDREQLRKEWEQQRQQQIEQMEAELGASTRPASTIPTGIELPPEPTTSQSTAPATQPTTQP